MTLNQIRAMFEPGQKWEASNEFNPKANGVRTVTGVYPTKIRWSVNNQPWTSPFPKASQIVEAREGFIRYRIFSQKDIAPGNGRTLDQTLSLTLL